MGHFRTFQANPHNWQSAPLLALRHQLEVLQEQSLRQGAGDRAIDRNVGHLAEGDAGDHHFDESLLAAPMAVEGNGWCRCCK